eukprot:4715849-Amphidinium_carterae.1
MALARHAKMVSRTVRRCGSATCAGCVTHEVAGIETAAVTEVVPWEEFATDGSAFWPARRRASWAICRLGGLGLQSGLVCAAEDPWQTVYGGELLGLRAALQRVGGQSQFQ